MEADERFWNREELYEEVWSVPMRTLAKKYGISDVGLAKVCRKLQIPLPGRGYWEKRAAGHDVQRIPLPPVEKKIFVQRPVPRKEKPPLEAFASTICSPYVARNCRISELVHIFNGEVMSEGEWAFC